MANRYPFQPGSLTDFDHASSLLDRYPEYGKAINWIERFVLKEYSEINRPGAVCPLLARTIKANLLWLVAITSHTQSANEAYQKGQYLADLYPQIFKRPREHRLGALLTIFPNLDPGCASNFIDDGHRRLRMDFVRRGLMIGEFHLLSPVGSIHNPDFMVMRCPVPMFAVRALSPHDVKFLGRDEIPPGERAQYLTYYLKHLGPTLNPAMRGRVEKSLSTARQATHTGSHS